MDSFIFPVDLAYISPPPLRQILRRMVSRADLAKHHPPPPPPAPPACPPNGDSPSNANVKHRRGELDSFNAATSTVRCLARSSRNRKNQPSVYRAESVCTYIYIHIIASRLFHSLKIRPTSAYPSSARNPRCNNDARRSATWRPRN